MAEVDLTRDKNVAIITLRAPARRNSFTESMAHEMLDICEQVDRDATFGCAVLMAEGASFCAGAHRDLLSRASQDPTEQSNYEALGLAYSTFVRFGTLRVPTVAAVRGHAVGAGVNLLLAADLRIVAEEARIFAGFHRLGLHPGGGHFSLLGRLGGREVAAALGLFGLPIDGRRAVSLGLAWEALPGDQVEARALEIAQGVSDDPPLARAMVKSLRLELGPPALPWEASLESERAPQMWSLRRGIKTAV